MTSRYRCCYSWSLLAFMAITKLGKMARLSCHSTASTAVCVDPRSVAIVPRKGDRAVVVDNNELVDVKYVPLPAGSKSSSGALLSRGEAGRGLRASTALITSCRSFDYRSFPAMNTVVAPGLARRDVIVSDVKGVATVPSTCKASSDHPFQVMTLLHPCLSHSFHCVSMVRNVLGWVKKRQNLLSPTKTFLTFSYLDLIGSNKLPCKRIHLAH